MNIPLRHWIALAGGFVFLLCSGLSFIFDTAATKYIIGVSLLLAVGGIVQDLAPPAFKSIAQFFQKIQRPEFGESADDEVDVEISGESDSHRRAGRVDRQIPIVLIDALTDEQSNW